MELLSINLIEMKYNRENAWCCGAGGGSRAAFSDWSLDTARKRVEMALETGAERLVSACPFCKRNLKDASGERIEVLDISELVDKLT
jgi:Fe-S oxidoreductase